jgi:hypothetical protein
MRSCAKSSSKISGETTSASPVGPAPSGDQPGPGTSAAYKVYAKQEVAASEAIEAAKAAKVAKAEQASRPLIDISGGDESVRIANGNPPVSKMPAPATVAPPTMPVTAMVATPPTMPVPFTMSPPAMTPTAKTKKLKKKKKKDKKAGVGAAVLTEPNLIQLDRPTDEKAMMPESEVAPWSVEVTLLD